MATSFYEFSVPTFLQTVKAIASFLDVAVAHCAKTRADPEDFVRDAQRRPVRRTGDQRYQEASLAKAVASARQIC